MSLATISPRKRRFRRRLHATYDETIHAGLDGFERIAADGEWPDGTPWLFDYAETVTSVGPIWAAEGPATLHLTLNPVVEPGPGGDQAVARSVLLIIDPSPPPAIRVATVITQELRRAGGSWRITRRIVAPPGGGH
jgi:hypothetical protein